MLLYAWQAVPLINDIQKVQIALQMKIFQRCRENLDVLANVLSYIHM